MDEIRQNSALSQKVGELIKRYRDLRLQNEELRNELVELKAQNEALCMNLSKLEDGISAANLSENDLLQQIQSVLEE
ncbi:MAG: hypothetical protein IJT33_04145 [Campylobacter sp.]|uniref:hypothetical protein n=1 Tax=unclassified Campylobacter TaxID=2593542 RepID=UPI001B5E96F0|nr:MULTISPECIES: hypothetical protein [unclassified Campylobacter]MBP5779273.1 hypothetical protein [Campylobacter sp.]MBQ7675634.1 hypothetical protein [Campylobacter sp.]MDA3055621.1 hypothetical protein [Campylobacter sp. CN_NA1]MDA3064689.1 hypothetical protein [Campylobacter sp. CN_NE4]MDA3068487.1 hypothetical protein [Campylobacter sp. CN_NE3]